MSATDSISNTDRINYLNIGLMIISLAVAFVVPFELFLFSYAVLGPLHYLTEISWLHERKYFTKGKYDYIFLGIAGLILFLLVYFAPASWNVLSQKKDPSGNVTTFYTSTVIVYVAFVASLAMVFLKSTFHRLIAFLFICVSIIISKGLFLLFSVFMPTLIHVYFFTFLFMLYGALKSKSKSGYLSCFVLAVIPFIIVYFDPGNFGLTNYAFTHYQKFDTVNKETLSHFFDLSTLKQGTTWSEVIYKSDMGLIVMRFIAFAYTYHYLNWFSKTTVIKWHQVPKLRLLIIGVLWIAAVIFYMVKYELGFNVLFFLSFLHVFLEFPLNHVTFVGIFKELGLRLLGEKKAIPVKSGVNSPNRGKKK
ncbi:MAG TPA: hypothetical protein VFJ43_16090 [Bacteroidia bacterium]|nr:hypothetical protein [Bacteroidia bacterium]